MNTAVMFSSKTDNWATPQDFFDDLNREFGFTLDPCADSLNHKCPKYYTRKQNGLAQDWGGSVFFATHPTVKKLQAGWRNLLRKARNPEPLWLCSFLPGRTQGIFTSTYTGKRKSVLSGAA